MGCMFSSVDDDDQFDDTSSGVAAAADDNNKTISKNRKLRASDIIDGGVMIKALQVTAAGGKHANESSDAANISQNAEPQRQRQQRQSRILMAADAGEARAERAPHKQGRLNKERSAQTFSLFNLLAQGRKVIQSAKVRVNAIDSLQKTKTKSASTEVVSNQQRRQTGILRRKMDEDNDEMLVSNLEPFTREDLSQSPSVVTTTSNSSSKRTINNQSASNDDVILFTNIQQLCMKIVKGSIVHNSRLAYNRSASATIQSTMTTSDAGRSDKPYCVFLFGAQGSCKGELAFDLVQHSPLLRTITVLANSRKSGGGGSQEKLAYESLVADCPLYHHIDVAALIIANIDSRIREYIHLQVQAIHSKRLEQQQHEVSQNSQSEGQNSEETSNFELITEDETDCEKTAENSASSELSDSSSIQFGQMKHRQASDDDDDFSLVTLSTKHRSMLELKLIKYSNCVSSKWVMGLIGAEIDRLESRVGQSQEGVGQDSSLLHRERVYLINLVPNQLSLFKSCLYLHQQELRLKEFKYRAVALKIERRTNIKVMTKERAVDRKPSANKSTIKTITGSLSVGKKQPSNSSEHQNCDKNKDSAVIVATDALTSGLTEKLGPKLNDIFVEQFKSMRRLYRARSNRGADCEHDYGNDDNSSCSGVHNINRLSSSLILYAPDERQANNEELPGDDQQAFQK